MRPTICTYALVMGPGAGPETSAGVWGMGTCCAWAQGMVRSVATNKSEVARMTRFRFIDFSDSISTPFFVTSGTVFDRPGLIGLSYFASLTAGGLQVPSRIDGGVSFAR